MPRELVHWKVLTTATDRLPSGKLLTALQTHPFAAKLGAMAPDAFYYYRFGGSPLEEVAERIHGAHGEDTLAPARAMLQGQNGSPALLSFLAGFISHLATDIVFHPFVYALTGDYYDPDNRRRKEARTAHRLMETHFENFVRSEKAREDTLLNCFRKIADRDFQEILNALDAALPAHHSWKSALFQMAALQRAFINRPISLLAHSLNAALGGRLRDKTVLFRPTEPSPLAPAETKQIVHPVTNTPLVTSFDVLAEEAEQKLTRWFEALHSDLEETTNGDFGNIVGESLNSGIVHGKNSDMVYFAADLLWNSNNKARL